MSVRDTRWLRLRRQLGPLTRRIPYGHVVTETATYARLLVPPALRPKRRFVIFAQGRSGSTLLADLLNSHPDVYCADEILTWKRRDPARYAMACSIGHRGDTYGFKVKIYHLTEAQQVDPHELLEELHTAGWSLVHLHRRNVLRQALSSLVAAQRRTYHVPVGAAAPPPVSVDVAELLRMTEDRARYCVQEDEALDGLPHLRVVYEDDLLPPDQHQQTADRVFTFLGLDTVPVSTSLRKLAPPDRPLAEVVANADEVAAAVRASPYHALLDHR